MIFKNNSEKKENETFKRAWVKNSANDEKLISSRSGMEDRCQFSNKWNDKHNYTFVTLIILSLRMVKHVIQSLDVWAEQLTDFVKDQHRHVYVGQTGFQIQISSNYLFIARRTHHYASI